MNEFMYYLERFVAIGWAISLVCLLLFVVALGLYVTIVHLLKQLNKRREKMNYHQLIERLKTNMAR